MWSRAMVLFISTKNRLYIRHKHADLWCGSESEVPEWLSIYYLKTNDQMKCNICEVLLNVDEKSMELLEHIKFNHREIYDLHKENPEATVGFRIEFLNLNVLKDSNDIETQPIIISEVCEETSETLIKPVTDTMDTIINSEIVVTPVKKKGRRRESESRKKSWVWKYFDRMSNIIYRCTICGVILSIKGCNTNNMNRHVRTKHTSIYQQEMAGKKLVELETQEQIIDNSIEKVEICDSDVEIYDKGQKQLQRRSWIWLYFDRISNTLAQCKLCHRNICHGGNATGNMNRHLKMIHNKTGPEDHTWIWKVFDKSEGVFSCKICQFKCLKFTDSDKNVSCILQHLKLDHGVVSGKQIIMSTECDGKDSL